jgi:plasmid replication initiation protein
VSIRQLRLSDRNQIITRLPEFINKQINIIKTDNTVVLANLEKVGNNSITIRNTKSRKIELPLNNIYEIYFDIDI